MEPSAVARVALPLLLALFVVVLLVWPVLRLRRATGVRAVTLHRPGQRFGALAFLAVAVGAVALCAAYALGGPAAAAACPPSAAGVAGGIGVAAAGLVLVAVAQRQMGDSFRIGIDDERTTLVDTGAFGFVRNPIFSGVLAMLAGVVLLAPGPWSALLLGVAALAVAVQTRLEERHLLALHGDAWRHYASRTGRFVPWLGRLHPPEDAAAGHVDAEARR